MAELSLVTVSTSSTQEELCQTASTSRTTPPPPQITPTKDNATSMVVDKTLGTAANLVKLLPCGTVLAFQALSPSFSNHGVCHSSNIYLTIFLILLCSLSCFFFSFTDSFIGFDGKHYYGIATFKGFYIFNHDDHGEEGERNSSLEKLRIRVVDFVHAFFSCLVFLALAFSDSNVQNCFFNGDGTNAMELLENLPLGIAFLSSLVFVIFPTSRKGIGYSDTAHTTR